MHPTAKEPQDVLPGQPVLWSSRKWDCKAVMSVPEIQRSSQRPPRVNSTCPSGMLNEGLKIYRAFAPKAVACVGELLPGALVRVRVLLGTAALVHAGGVV